MKAITLRPQWAHAVAHLGKATENRQAWNERTPAFAQARKLVGAEILIHAGADVGTCARFDADVDAILDIAAASLSSVERAEIRARLATVGGRPPRGYTPVASLVRSAVVARAVLVDILDLGNTSGHRYSDTRGGGCLGCGYARPTVAELIEHGPFHVMGPALCPNRDRWATCGGFGLLLADVGTLAVPVPWSGAQGWFDVPAVLVGGA